MSAGDGDLVVAAQHERVASGWLAGRPQVREPFEQPRDGDAELEPRQGSAQAEVDSGAERDVAVGRAVDGERVDIVERGMADGTFAPGLDVEATAALVMQTIFGALRLRALGPGLELTPIGSERIYAFCLRALEN